MRNRLSSLKRFVLGLAIVAALSAAPAFAASPTISDNGSAYWTARVYGSGFTPSGWFSTNQAYVLIYNGSDGAYASQTVQTSGSYCSWFVCYGGGTFTSEIYMAPHQCSNGRWANAYDYASGLWTGWIALQCS
jgi:hypothetical protein